jgi:Skp family chaperone for outer membrane proteins
MKKRIFILAFIGLITGMLITSCGKTSEQKVEGAKENFEGVKDDLKDAKTAYLAEWQAFKEEADEKIDANQKRIEAFKAKMSKAGSTAKENYNKEVAVLEQKNQDLKKKLDEYKDDGQSKWKEFKANFNDDMDAIGKTMTDLFKDQS